MRRSSLPGFTLIESVTALSIAGIILAALGSVLAMSLKAFPRPEADPSAESASMQDAQVWLKDDLGSATSIVSASTTAIEFRVADRDSDTVPETIRYWWPGEGERLKRTINGGNETVLGPVLSDLVFSTWWRDVSLKSASASIMGADEVLFRYPGASNATQSIGTTMLAVTITPVLAVDTTAWCLKSCEVWASTTAGPPVSGRARLYTGVVTNVSSQTPIATAAVVGIAAGSSNVAVTCVFFPTPEISPGQQVTIVFDTLLSSGRMSIKYNTSSVPLSTMSAQTGSGSTWTSFAGGGAPISVIGTQKKPGVADGLEPRLFGVGVAAVPKRQGAFPARFAVGTPAEPKIQ